jgi:lipoprotein-anchoring transpeptidase ErfK/SrfK
MPIPRHYTLTSDDRTAMAQWRRTILAAYGAIALACVVGVSASNYLSPADASKGAALTLSDPTSSAPAEVTAVNPAQPQSPAIFETASEPTTSDALAENAWDFNRPETIPGFGPMTPTAPRHAQQTRNAESASAAPEQSGVDIRALLEDPAIRAQAGLAENHWDFNNTDSIPGFGSMPPADVSRRVAGRPEATEW